MKKHLQKFFKHVETREIKNFIAPLPTATIKNIAPLAPANISNPAEVTPVQQVPYDSDDDK